MSYDSLQNAVKEHKLSPEKVTQLLREALTEVFPEVLQRASETIGTNIEATSKDKTYCGLLNGETILALMRRFQLPGMVFRIDVDPHGAVKFKDTTWHYHSVGIVLLEGEPFDKEARYAVIDTTVKNPQDALIEVGTLQHLTTVLDKQYGANWRLDFVPETAPDKSIPAKIKNASNLLASGQTVENLTFTSSIGYVGPDSQSERIKQPLGLKTSLIIPEDQMSPTTANLFRAKSMREHA